MEGFFINETLNHMKYFFSTMKKDRVSNEKFINFTNPSEYVKSIKSEDVYDRMFYSPEMLKNQEDRVHSKLTADNIYRSLKNTS